MSGTSAEVGHNWLYESPDGREAWVLFDPTQNLAFICTDIHQQGPPNQAVGFSAGYLRMIADRLEELVSNPVEENS